MAAGASRVPLRGGGQAWILLHVEVEARAGRDFARRMYVYNHRLFERYGEEVVSLAVLTHAGERYRARPYERRRWGFHLLFRFPAVKLMSYRGRESRLARSRNPFSLIVLAHLRRKQARGDPLTLFSAKKGLVQILYERGWLRDDMLNLLRFLDWLLRLPRELEERFDAWIAEYESQKSMPYITSFERLATRRGLKKGLKEGLKRGLEEGRAKGRAEGRAEGRVKTLTENIAAVLQTRFGKQGAKLVTQVRLPADPVSLAFAFRRLLKARNAAAAARILTASRRGRS